MEFFGPGVWEGRLYSRDWGRASARIREVIEPATGSVIGSYFEASMDDLERAAAASTVAQRTWEKFSARDRAEILKIASVIIGDNADVLSDWLVREAGSSKEIARREVELICAEFFLAAGPALATVDEPRADAKPQSRFARRRPIGTAGVITPFHSPGVSAARAVAPALAHGNAVILKPDLRTAVSGGLFMASALEEAGLPAGAFQVMPGDDSIGIGLVESPNVDVISFSGSERAARVVSEAAGRHLKRMHVELGGTDTLVVMGDADVSTAVSMGAAAGFLHRGQENTNLGRHVVHSQIYDEYVERLAQAAINLSVGDPTKGAQLGPVIDVPQRDKVHALVTSTIEAGAQLATGGAYAELFYQPTVLANVATNFPAFAQQVTGPVVSVLRFNTQDELAEILSHDKRGRSLFIVTKDGSSACHLAKRLPFESVHVNERPVDLSADAPIDEVSSLEAVARSARHESFANTFTETQWVTVQS